MSVIYNINKRTVGEIWTDNIDGKKVMTVRDTNGSGCMNCAYSTFSGGACPGVIYDRHPCCASDREDGHEVYYKLIAYVPEAQAAPLRMKTFTSVPFKIN